MAGGRERILRRRIRSVEATKKITRAMELIAASQMVRAQARIAGARPYVNGIAEVLAVTARDATSSRVIGEPENPERTLLIALVGDRGLSGAYNSSVLRQSDRLLRAGDGTGHSFQIVTVGRKAIAFFRFRGRSVERSFTQMSDRPSFEDARALASAVVGPFLAGEVDLVELVSTRFLSAGVQRVETRRILPLPADAEHGTEAPRSSGTSATSNTEPAGATSGIDLGAQRGQAGGFYEFEPAPEQLLELLVPQYTESVLYQALLEASAAEHTARQRAMAAATENAEDLITNLRRVMNRARQDSITTEIMEIVGGAEALRGASDLPIHHLLADENEEQIA